MKAILYHRVSTAEQDPELARAQLYAAAEQRGLDVLSYIREVGSGARGDRPGLQRVMQRVREGGVHSVLVWKLDRFGRSVIDVLTNIRTLRGAGVRFVATSQGLDIGPEGDAVSALMMHMLAAVAEFERELIRERTNAGIAKARRQGKRLGRPLARNAPDPAKVRRLRKMGHSWSQIALSMRCSTSAVRRAFQRGERAAAVVDGELAALDQLQLPEVK